MDLQNQFKDLNLDENLDKDTVEIEKKLAEENLPAIVEPSSEGQQIISDLEKRLAEIKKSEGIVEGEDQEEEEDEEEKTLLEALQPYILPICLTLFALVFAALFLYFFSKSRVDNAVNAITNVGAVDPSYYPQTPSVVVTEEPLKCELPNYLNEAGDACLEPVLEEEEPEPEVIAKLGFENGTTTIVNVRFSFDKYNYDNYPRGIYLLEDQIFEGGFLDFKIAPTNRAFANDHFFGVDRYTVSLIGNCSYVVDDARILVKNMYDKGKYFTGNVVKVIEASKPRVDCEK